MSVLLLQVTPAHPKVLNGVQELHKASTSTHLCELSLIALILILVCSLVLSFHQSSHGMWRLPEAAGIISHQREPRLLFAAGWSILSREACV